MRPVANPRMISVDDWRPTFPPIAAMTGMNVTTATTSWIVARKNHKIEPDTMLPIRLVSSQGTRSRTEWSAEECMSSSSSSICVPDIFSMSSVAASWMMSTTSSTVIIPTRVLSLSTTGIASRL